MNKKRAPKINKKLILVITVIAVLALGFGAYKYKQRNKPYSASTGAATVNTDSSVNEARKQATAQVETDKTANLPTQSTIPDRVVISSAAQDSKIGQVVIKTELHGSQWQKCELKLVNGNNTVTKEAGVLYQPDYSSCLGFAISLNEFPVAGKWSAILTCRKADESSVVSTSTEFTISK